MAQGRGGNGQRDDGKSRLSEDDIQRAQPAPRGVHGAPDPARMMSQQAKSHPDDVDPGQVEWLEPLKTSYGNARNDGIPPRGCGSDWEILGGR